ncbi:MAG: hypothetical protein Q9166_005150 [cf. Caloplaca sp. 2 TL-2023]
MPPEHELELQEAVDSLSFEDKLPKARALKPREVGQIYFSLRRQPLESPELTGILLMHILTILPQSLKSHDTKNLIPALQELYRLEAAGNRKERAFRDALVEVFCTRGFIQELTDINDGQRPHLERLISREDGGATDPDAVVFFMDIMRRALLKSLIQLNKPEDS